MLELISLIANNFIYLFRNWFFLQLFYLFSLITQNKQNGLWWGMDTNTSLLWTFACNLLYFTPFFSRIAQCQLPDESMA